MSFASRSDRRMASSKSAAASVRAAMSLSAFVEAFVSRSAVTSPDVRLRLCSLASEAGDRGSLPAREGLGSPEPPAAAAPSSGPAPRCCALACCSDIASAWRSRKAMLVGRDRRRPESRKRRRRRRVRGAHGRGARGRFGGVARRGHVERARDAPSAAAHRRRPPPSSRRADRVT